MSNKTSALGSKEQNNICILGWVFALTIDIHVSFQDSCSYHLNLPLITSTTLQLGSMLPMCFGWAGLIFPPNSKAAKRENI